MKLNRSIITVLALCALALPAVAEWDGYLTKAGAGTLTTNADVAFGSSVGKTLRLVSLNARTDLTTGAIYLAAGASTHITTVQVTSALTNFPVSSVGSTANGELLVIQTPTDVLYVRTAYAVTGTTNISTYETAGATIPVGSKIYRCSDIMTITPCSTNNIQLNSECLKSASKRMPIVIRITGTAACTIPAATVHYDE